MKATEQYFPVVLFIMLYKVILTFESVDKILNCDHSNESYSAVLQSVGRCLFFTISENNICFSFQFRKEWAEIRKIRDKCQVKTNEIITCEAHENWNNSNLLYKLPFFFSVKSEWDRGQHKLYGGGGGGKYGMRMSWRQSGRALFCWKEIGHDFVRVGMRKTSSGKQELKS